MRHPRSPLGIISIGSVIVGLAIGTLLGCQLTRVPPPQTISKDAAASFGLLAEAWNAIDRRYVDRTAIKPQTLTYGAIRGMVDALGDTGHSHFLSPVMVRQERNFSRGTLEGIGAEIQNRACPKGFRTKGQGPTGILQYPGNKRKCQEPQWFSYF